MNAEPHPAETIPQPTVTLRRHDRLNLELKLEHPADDATVDRTDSTVDLWFFLPPAIGITSETYANADFYRDLRRYSRYKTPDIPLDELARLDGDRSPLASLATIGAKLPTGPFPPKLAHTIRGEARLLVCMFRRACRDVHLAMVAATAPQREDCVSRASVHCVALLENWRSLRSRFQSHNLDTHTHAVLDAVDEALSLEVESTCSELLVAFPALSPKVRSRVVALATSERQLRIDRGDRSGVPWASTRTDPESPFLDQRNLLKKYTNQALFLSTKAHPGQRTLGHLARGLAAAVAMGWTVALQLATVFLFDLQLQSQVDLRVVVLFSLITVAGYILKDRIKDTLGKQLEQAIPRWTDDRRLHLIGPDTSARVGETRERTTFVAQDDVPDDVQALRLQTARTPIAHETIHQALHYRRRVRIHPAEASRHFPRMEGITDILRINLAAWIRTLGNRRKVVAVVTPDGTVREDTMENRYLVDVIARMTHDSGAVRLEMWRVVLTRRGLVRVDEGPTHRL